MIYGEHVFLSVDFYMLYIFTGWTFSAVRPEKKNPEGKSVENY